MKQIIAPAAINALKEALTHIYWYKSDLRSFLLNTISDPYILSQLNWNDYKRNIIGSLISFFSKNQEKYQQDLLRLMNEVVKINDFSHLERLENGNEKAETARNSVLALRKIVEKYFNKIDETKELEEKRREYFKKTLLKKEITERLEIIKMEYFQLIGSQNFQDRGYQLERILKDLFTIFDLDPRSSFRTEGEQIDGAFTFDNIDYLFEAKWQTRPVGIKEMDAFAGKLNRKLDNTLGLFLSINGFSEDAVKTLSTGRPVMILMDGSDLMAVLEGRIDLLLLLLRKRRHASQTGNIYLRIHEVLID